jgi:cytochrome c oxidase subunit 2
VTPDKTLLDRASTVLGAADVPRRTGRRRGLLLVGGVLVASVALSACGSDTSKSNAGGSETAKAAIAEFGCAGCHSTDGSVRVGPTWKGLAGKRVVLEDGSTVTADDAYLRRSITDPSAQRVKGANVEMPKLAVSPEQVDAIVAYIKTLK